MSVSERKSCGIFVWMHFGCVLLFFFTSLFGATIGIVKIHRASWWVFLVEGRWYPSNQPTPGPATQSAPGLAIGIVGDAGVRANAQQPRLFVGMILILIFAEVLMVLNGRC